MPIPAKLEITLKINRLPPDVTTDKNGWKSFQLDCAGRLVSVSLRPRMWNKLVEANGRSAWAATIVGQMGPLQGNGFTLMEPAVQIFERRAEVRPEDGALIDAVYQAELGRAAGPSAISLHGPFVAGRRTSGEAPEEIRAEIAAKIRLSGEYRMKHGLAADTLVEAVYQAELGRAATEGDLVAGRAFVGEGRRRDDTDEAIREGLVEWVRQSKEYSDKHDPALIEELFQAELGRASNPEERASYLQFAAERRRGGDDDVAVRERIAGRMRDTDEHRKRRLELADPPDLALIEAVFQKEMQRAGTLTEKVRWLSWIGDNKRRGRSPEQLRDYFEQELSHTLEYRTTLVESAYRSELGRASDQAGMAKWLDWLKWDNNGPYKPIAVVRGRFLQAFRQGK